MRRAFAACLAFAIVVIAAAIHFGSPRARVRPPIDAAIADAAIDAPAVIVDAAPPPPPPKNVASKPKRPVVKPTPKPPVAPPVPNIVIPPPVGHGCTQPANPAGCPATEPNVNRPCDAEGVHCTYGASCCPPVYVCSNGAFEAWFTHCP